MSVYGMSEVLLDLSDLAHDARVAGHSEVEIARAAGIEVTPCACRNHTEPGSDVAPSLIT